MKASDEKKHQRAQLQDECEVLMQTAKVENRDLTEAETTKFNSHMARISLLDSQIKDDLDEELAVKNVRKLQMAGMPPVTPTFNADSTPYTGTPLTAGNVQARVVMPRLVAYQGPNAHRDAYDDGLLFKARLLSHTTRHAEGQAALDKYIARRGDTILASQNENSTTDGGYLVTPSFDNAVVTYREKVGAVRQLFRIVNTGNSDSWTGFKQTSGTTIYLPGEESEITASSAQFGRYTLFLKKRAILTYISSELRDDSLVSIMDIVASDMGHQFALQEDKDGIVGDGTSTYGNIQGVRPAIIAATASISTAATGHDTWAELDISDFAGVMSKISDAYRTPDMAWLCSAAFKWQVMDRLAIGSNGALSQVWVDGQPQNMFLGYRVVLSDRMPTSGAAATVCALFGNFREAAVLAEQAGVRIATSEHVAFTSDRIALRGTVRYDMNVHQEGDTSTAGAIAGLKTAA